MCKTVTNINPGGLVRVTSHDDRRNREGTYSPFFRQNHTKDRTNTTVKL
jgi:hypothetical protein